MDFIHLSSNLLINSLPMSKNSSNFAPF